jgi:hypothetical protein
VTCADDFATAVAVGELNPDVLGEDGFYAAAANCTVKTATIEVQFFEGGDSFRTYAARQRVRSGMTALSPGFCLEKPLTCGIIQVHCSARTHALCAPRLHLLPPTCSFVRSAR